MSDDDRYTQYPSYESDGEDAELPPPDDQTKNSSSDQEISIKSIWDSEHIEKVGTKGQADEKWICGFCKTQFRKWNTSKAMYHVAKLSGHHIKPCSGNIPSNLIAAYRALADRGKKNKAAITSSKRCHESTISTRIEKKLENSGPKGWTQVQEGQI